MSTEHHTAIAIGAAADAATFNNPLEELDAAIDDLYKVVIDPAGTHHVVTTTGASSGSENVDVQTIFSVPDGVTSVFLNVLLWDSGSAAAAANTMYVVIYKLGETDADKRNAGLVFIPSGVTNSTQVVGSVIVPVDTNGELTVDWYSSGTGTLGAWLYLRGYIIPA